MHVGKDLTWNHRDILCIFTVILLYGWQFFIFHNYSLSKKEEHLWNKKTGQLPACLFSN